MPYKKFLEEYSLYRKFKVSQLPPKTDALPVVQINMECPKCNSNQTFVMTNKYWENWQVLCWQKIHKMLCISKTENPQKCYYICPVVGTNRVMLILNPSVS